MAETFVIVGAGHAGGEAAAALRLRKFKGRIVVIGDEPHVPYERPPLSKQLLSGEFEVERTYLKPRAVYDSQDIELRLGLKVEAIDRAAHSLRLSDGAELGYDKLLIATGSRVRKLPVPGADLDGVHYVRTIADTLAIRDRLKPGARLVVVGGGYIGLEVAAVARKLGAEVAVLEALPRVMMRVVGQEIASFYEGVHRENGVDLRLGMAVTRIEGAEQVKRVICADGAALDADIVVIGVGIVPNIELAEAAGLEIDNGVVVDEFACTSDPDIFAAGDVTNHPNALLGGRLRLESVHNAVAQAQTAVRAMMGDPVAYAEVPWFWSDQYGLKLQMAGISRDGDEAVVRGDPASHKFSALYLRDGVVVAINAVNNMRDFMPTKRMIAARTRVDREKLADSGVSLKELL
ncbi:MAG: NAD(P)/FAD-dependent oxidoreductase [Sphingomonadales bacterium]